MVGMVGMVGMVIATTTTKVNHAQRMTQIQLQLQNRPRKENESAIPKFPPFNRLLHQGKNQKRGKCRRCHLLVLPVDHSISRLVHPVVITILLDPLDLRQSIVLLPNPKQERRRRTRRKKKRRTRKTVIKEMRSWYLCKHYRKESSCNLFL